MFYICIWTKQIVFNKCNALFLWTILGIGNKSVKNTIKVLNNIEHNLRSKMVNKVMKYHNKLIYKMYLKEITVNTFYRIFISVKFTSLLMTNTSK